MERNSYQPKVCAVIPAYNEHGTLGKVVQEIKKYVDTVIVLDDGSTDDTGEIARQNGAQVFRHESNRGIGLALQSGYDIAISNNFDLVVQLDADGQHDPKHIAEMLNLIKNCDVIIGSRFPNQSHRQYPVVRRAGISFFTAIVNFLGGTRVTDVTSGYRMYRTQVLKKLTPLSERHWAVGQTLEIGKMGFTVKEISIEMPVRSTGKSQFSFIKYALYPFRMILIIIKVMALRSIRRRGRGGNQAG